jgi:LysR family transcriptional regulator, low CO2-responsive transcriptional regulator
MSLPIGVGFLSAHAVQQELALRRLAVKGFPVMRHWYIVHRRVKEGARLIRNHEKAMA